MSDARFLQIHTLHSYAGVLLNRDDTGQAKRLLYGGVQRTRISSQCLKWHWRYPNGRDIQGGPKDVREPHAFERLERFVDSKRSRALVKEEIIAPLRDHYPQNVLEVLESAFDAAVYGKSSSAPTLLFGRKELDWLRGEAERLAKEAQEAKENAEDVKKRVAAWAKEYQSNIAAFRAETKLPGGLIAALFGRMVTSDPQANIEAPIHVAHAFTVHKAETEDDFFIAADDLAKAESAGADHMGETELNSGIFYGYVVVDMPGLIANCRNDRELASKVVHSLTYLIAEVSPGAKRGSTAPYGRSVLMLVESGDRQPRSLAGAFRKPIEPDVEKAVVTLDRHLKMFDHVYKTGEQRMYLTISQSELSEIQRVSMEDLAAWAENQVLVSK